MRRLPLYSLLLTLPLMAAEPEFAFGVVSPEGSSAYQGNAGAASFGRIALDFARKPEEDGAGFWFRTTLEGDWGSTGYATGGQSIRVQVVNWVGGVDCCGTLPVSIGSWRMECTGYLGLGYALNTTTYSGTVPGTERTGKPAFEGGVEVMPFPIGLVRVGLGGRFRKITAEAGAVASDSTSIYAMVRF